MWKKIFNFATFGIIGKINTEQITFNYMNNKMGFGISMVADFEGDIQMLYNDYTEDELPILATRNYMMFPGIVSPIMISRDSSKKLVSAMDKKKKPTVFAVFCQKNTEAEEPGEGDLYDYGVYARLLKVIEFPGRHSTAIIQGLGRCKMGCITKKRPYMKGYVAPVFEPLEDDNDKEFTTAVEDLRNVAIGYVRSNDDMPDEMTMSLRDYSNKTILTNFICASMPFSMVEKSDLLACKTVKDRVFDVTKLLNREAQLMQLKQDIRTRTREEIDEQQREYFLKQQIKNIKQELGGDEGMPERKELMDKAAKKLWSKETEEVFRREYDKLDTFNQQSPEYAIQLTYLQNFVSLPWNEYTVDDLNLTRAQKTLDADHYGMEKVKERILEYIAVLSLKGDLKSPILCLYGPPGVGKTSLGKSIAKSMKRKYVRVSLGGVHDEAEIRGHRRTYVGAMPGRIIKSIQKAGSSNPVFILDEIDKVSQNNINGDPNSALLEVLDPEQNNAFHDNYLDVDYDLSKVLFIATANDLGTIPRPLLDRMEIIEVGGYITEEKQEIARRHLIPKEKQNTGLDGEKRLTFTKSATEKIIENYTRESGVRQLEKQINKALRKLAFMKAKDGDLSFTHIGLNDLETLLGKPPYYRDIYQGNKYAGVVTGLAWTSVGGEILFIETSLSKGKGSRLTLTGNLGDVMKESAMLALEFVKSHSDVLGIDYRIFDNWNIHIHVPEGATPKDGPSAGITIATSIASALTQRKVRRNVAMTGEITLRGKVLPVGGIKEKILAAKRAGITDIVLCHENQKDIEEIPEIYFKGVSFHYVENVLDVWNFALTDELVDNPADFTIPEDEAKGKDEADKK